LTGALQRRRRKRGPSSFEDLFAAVGSYRGIGHFGNVESEESSLLYFVLPAIYQHFYESEEKLGLFDLYHF
jgi:hypothetical protein